jgi:hypothetical protein
MVKGEVGDVFVDYRSFSDTIPFRLQAHEYKLERIEIYVSGTIVYIGNPGRQLYPLANTKTLILHNIDLADLWFKGDGNAEKVYVIGTTR